jgi:3'-phosphoadenosine 5'-phosphosulfate (PAPS) 3'-phosphatase
MTNVVESSPSTLLAAAEELARLTGGVALSHYRSALAVEQKADGSPVTAADRAAEQAAREWVRSRFPDDGVLDHRSHRWYQVVRARRAAVGLARRAV